MNPRDYLGSSELVTETVDGGETKICLFNRENLARAYMAGAILLLHGRVGDLSAPVKPARGPGDPASRG